LKNNSQFLAPIRRVAGLVSVDDAKLGGHTKLFCGRRERVVNARLDEPTDEGYGVRAAFHRVVELGMLSNIQRRFSDKW
jgi:hypothetical protein